MNGNIVKKYGAHKTIYVKTPSTKELRVNFYSILYLIQIEFNWRATTTTNVFFFFQIYPHIQSYIRNCGNGRSV